eukprot:2727682-Rhodomonas_salina.1
MFGRGERAQACVGQQIAERLSVRASGTDASDDSERTLTAMMTVGACVAIHETCNAHTSDQNDDAQGILWLF